MTTKDYKSPCGTLRLGVHGDRLVLCDWMVPGRIEKSVEKLKRRLPRMDAGDDMEVMNLAVRQLDEYFEGKKREFDVPLLPCGTEFQLSVWEALLDVGYAETTHYSDVAEAVGRRSAVRAVANAIGANPLSIFIPCHRIIGSDGSLTGYAGGLSTKSFLLNLEKAVK